jgi:hypothetical protein
MLRTGIAALCFALLGLHGHALAADLRIPAMKSFHGSVPGKKATTTPRLGAMGCRTIIIEGKTHTICGSPDRLYPRSAVQTTSGESGSAAKVSNTRGPVNPKKTGGVKYRDDDDD